MICCLCLKYSENVKNIFEDNEETGKNMALVVAKYFWFEPCKDDPMCNVAICASCALRLLDFHQFYEMVENAHKNDHPTESVIIKTEEAPMVFNGLPNKNEPTDVFGDELSEVSFPLTSAYNERSNSCDALSQSSVPRNDNSKECDDNDNDSEGMKFNDEPCNDSEETDPMYEPKSHTFTKKELFFTDTKSCGRRSTRSSKKIKALDISEKEMPSAAKIGKKRVTKQEKADKAHKPKPKRQNQKDTSDTSPDKRTAYKDKMQSFDAQISQYMGLHCDVCNIAAENFASLKLHMRSEHNMENGYVKCCDKKFHRRANLLYHIRHHVNPDCYRCEECNRAFSDYQSLRNHINVKHQKEEDKIYECGECSKKFAKKYLLEQHKTFKHKDRSTKCKMCNKRHETIDELAEHNKVPCVSGIMCDICAKVIYGPAAFKRHQLDHEDGPSNREQCDLCGSWHRDKYALRKHKRRHLEPKKPHVCDICNKISPSREAMISHKRYAHSTDRSFECEFCQKSFKKALSLKEHITTHTGEVLYTCPHCPKTFNSNANMHSHRKNAHPREFEEARKRRKRVAYVSDQNILGPTVNDSSVFNDNK